MRDLTCLSRVTATVVRFAEAERVEQFNKELSSVAGKFVWDDQLLHNIFRSNISGKDGLAVIWL